MNWFRLTVLILLIYIATLISVMCMLEIGDFASYAQIRQDVKYINGLVRTVSHQVSRLHYDRLQKLEERLEKLEEAEKATD